MMKGKDDFNVFFQDFMKKGKIDPLKHGVSVIMELFTEYLNQLGKKISDFTDAVADFGGLGAVISEIWNFEEIKVDEYTFSSCIQWLKKHIDKSKHSAGCLLKVEQDKSLDKHNEYPLHFHLCFLDNNNNPLLDGKSPHAYIYAKKIDEDLSDSFENQSMLLIK